MSKTRNPYPDSFLAFACRLDAYAASVDEEWPDCFPPMVPATELLTEDAARVRRAAKRHDASRHCWDLVTRRVLLDEGVTEHELALPVGAKLVADRVAFIHHIEALKFDLQPLRTRAPDQFTTDDWKPSRKIVSEMIAGVHFAFGEGNRAKTAHALGRGIPTKDRGSGATPYDVRNAMNTVARSMWRLEEEKPAIWALLASDMRNRAKIADTIWRDIERSPRFRSKPKRVVFEILRSNGQLLDRYSDLEEHYAEYRLRKLGRLAAQALRSATLEILVAEQRRRRQCAAA